MSEQTKNITHSNNITLENDLKSVTIIDQTELPNRTTYINLSTPEQMFNSIKLLKVRGAPAIGICAGYCIFVLSMQSDITNYDDFLSEFVKNKNYLNSARPTAVNLSWALNRMHDVVKNNCDKSVVEIKKLLHTECLNIHNEDIEMCFSISEHGLSLVTDGILKDGDGIFTYCNAGPLATSNYGTALGPLFLGKERNINFKVYSCETRPLLQGARLTSYELHKGGIDVTLMCDNMMSIAMKSGFINACFVGCDRIAANGDTANKIGTSAMAILAKHYNIPFYVLGPTSTIDMNCPTGDDIEIELRDPDEIKTNFYKEPMALPGVKCYNPAFDVTDNDLITGIITEKGICKPPFTKSIANLFS